MKHNEIMFSLFFFLTLSCSSSACRGSAHVLSNNDVVSVWFRAPDYVRLRKVGWVLERQINTHHRTHHTQPCQDIVDWSAKKHTRIICTEWDSETSEEGSDCLLHRGESDQRHSEGLAWQQHLKHFGPGKLNILLLEQHLQLLRWRYLIWSLLQT